MPSIFFISIPDMCQLLAFMVSVHPLLGPPSPPSLEGGDSWRREQQLGRAIAAFMFFQCLNPKYDHFVV